MVKIQRISEHGVSRYIYNTTLRRGSINRLPPTNQETVLNLKLLAKEKLAFPKAVSQGLEPHFKAGLMPRGIWPTTQTQ